MSETDTQADRKTRILIVDDHPLVRAGLAQMISDEPDLKVCCEAESIGEALKKIEQYRPELAIIDISLKEGSGLRLIKQIKARGESLKMLVLSMHDEALFAERALHAGALGYVEKHEAATKIIEAIRRVLSGRVYLSKQMTERVLSGLTGNVQKSCKSPIEHLSNRELEIFNLIGEGMTSGQIATHLNLSIKTIETHREKIKKKLNLGSGNELTRYAMQWVLEDS